LIRKDGSVAIADPLNVFVGKNQAWGEKNFKMIDKLIEAAKNNINE
jgi:hypothetical protein